MGIKCSFNVSTIMGKYKYMLLALSFSLLLKANFNKVT